PKTPSGARSEPELQPRLECPRGSYLPDRQAEVRRGDAALDRRAVEAIKKIEHLHEELPRAALGPPGERFRHAQVDADQFGRVGDRRHRRQEGKEELLPQDVRVLADGINWTEGG